MKFITHILILIITTDFFGGCKQKGSVLLSKYESECMKILEQSMKDKHSFKRIDFRIRDTVFKSQDLQAELKAYYDAPKSSILDSMLRQKKDSIAAVIKKITLNPSLDSISYMIFDLYFSAKNHQGDSSKSHAVFYYYPYIEGRKYYFNIVDY